MNSFRLQSEYFCLNNSSFLEKEFFKLSFQSPHQLRSFDRQSKIGAWKWNSGLKTAMLSWVLRRMRSNYLFHNNAIFNDYAVHQCRTTGVPRRLSRSAWKALKIPKYLYLLGVLNFSMWRCRGWNMCSQGCRDYEKVARHCCTLTVLS